MPANRAVNADANELGKMIAASNLPSRNFRECLTISAKLDSSLSVGKIRSKNSASRKIPSFDLLVCSVISHWGKALRKARRAGTVITLSPIQLVPLTRIFTLLSEQFYEAFFKRS